METPKFPLGQVVITPAAINVLSEPDVRSAIHRHVTGDWGNLDEHDKAENEMSLKHGFRLLSSYTSSSGNTFWIITEADRSVTTILLPSDY